MIETDPRNAGAVARQRRSEKKIRATSQKQIKLGDFELRLVLLLGFLSLGNKLAQLARMFAIEGFGQGFGQRS